MNNRDPDDVKWQKRQFNGFKLLIMKHTLNFFVNILHPFFVTEEKKHVKWIIEIYVVNIFLETCTVNLIYLTI